MRDPAGDRPGVLVPADGRASALSATGSTSTSPCRMDEVDVRIEAALAAGGRLVNRRLRPGRSGSSPIPRATRPASCTWEDRGLSVCGSCGLGPAAVASSFASAPSRRAIRAPRTRGSGACAPTARRPARSPASGTWSTPRTSSSAGWPPRSPASSAASTSHVRPAPRHRRPRHRRQRGQGRAHLGQGRARSSSTATPATRAASSPPTFADARPTSRRRPCAAPSGACSPRTASVARCSPSSRCTPARTTRTRRRCPQPLDLAAARRTA